MVWGRSLVGRLGLDMGLVEVLDKVEDMGQRLALDMAYRLERPLDMGHALQPDMALVAVLARHTVAALARHMVVALARHTVVGLHKFFDLKFVTILE